jgi:RecQ family ATP-dependent DNA helicase
MWGLVKRVEFDRGFGFISCQGLSKEVFFHFSRQQPSKSADEASLQAGKQIVFMLGSDEGKPDRRAVRWALAKDLNWGAHAPPHDQTGLDALRRNVLEHMPLDGLWHLLHADWYGRQHGANTPSDLDDPVLEAIWFERIAALTPDQLVAERVGQNWRQCRFRFLDMPNVNRLLDALSNQQLAAIGPPMQAWMNAVTTLGAFWQPQNRQRLLEWYLLSNDGAIATDWSRWFQGSEPFEAAAAKYLIDQGLRGNDVTKHWVRKLIGKGLLDQTYLVQWVGECDLEAVSAFEQLTEQRQREFWAAWIAAPSRLQAVLDVMPSAVATLLRTVTIAVDLETDGQAIWEVGCARAKQKELLYDQKQGGNLSSALEQFAQRLQSTPLLVGHNLLAWDWPVLSQHLDVARPPQLWDTLLVQYLLAPQASSHALGSSHHADDDALAALNRFEEQIASLAPPFARELILGEFADGGQLLGGVAKAMSESTSYARVAPNWLASCDSTDALVVLPIHRLQEVDWVPGVTVVCANPAENLPSDLLQIDIDRLALAMRGEATHDAPTVVLLAVSQRAHQQGIALRMGMIAPWLLESSAALAAAVRHACFEPRIGQVQGRCVASMPCDVGPLLASGPSAYRLLDCPDQVLVFDEQPVATRALQELATSCIASPLVRVGRSGDVQVWLQSDRPARLLEKAAGWRSFRTAPVPDQMALRDPTNRVAQTAPPILATRRTLVLYPNAMDQAGYWIEVIRTFRELANGVANAVPILLVGSSQSSDQLDLLNIGLAEIGWGELQPEHRSRLEHLRRAVNRGYALVDLIERWPEWQALAVTAEVSLLPVVEALPLERWYAAAQALLPQEAEDKGEVVDDSEDASGAEPAADGDESVDEVDDDLSVDEMEFEHQAIAHQVVRADAVAAMRPVGMAALLEKLAELMASNLKPWLIATGLNRSEHPVRLMDSRATTLGQGLREVVELMPLSGEPLPTDHIERLKQVFEALQIQRESAPSDFASMEQFLVKHWQPISGGDLVTGFKASQIPAMEAICDRANDVLVVLPTGEGKSVLFQVPALCRGLRTRRLTLVLSPLKALMRDQVERLRLQGFGESAEYLSSDRPAHEIADVLQGVLDHRIVLLYVAPERLRSEMFVTVLRQRVESDGLLEYAVVDETHCVNQWGHQFRPDYFHAMDMLLQEFRADANDATKIAPILLLSATVTASDRKQLKGLVDSVTKPDQPTIPFANRPDGFVQPLGSHVQVQPVRVLGRINAYKAFEQMLPFRLPEIVEAIEQAKANQGRTNQRSAVIIFVSRREHAEKLGLQLASTWGSEVDYFHAGLPAATREEVLKDFQDGKINVLVATKAFGMGMDIPDIHWAIHLGPPAFLEDYLQEVGRIGRSATARDRAKLTKLEAKLLFSPGDFEGLRTERAKGALHLSVIKKFYEDICANAQQIDGAWMALVPQDGFNPPRDPSGRRQQATKLRMALYWLERTGSLRLSGLVPNLLSVTLNRSQLEKIAADGGKLALMARVILGIEPLPTVTVAPQPSPGVGKTLGNWLGRALDRLGDMVGFLLGISKPVGSITPSVPEATSIASSTPETGAAVINVSQIMLRCSIKSISDVMASLVDLEKRGGLELKRDFQFAPRALAKEPFVQIGQLCEAVRGATEELIRRVGEQGKLRFEIDELTQNYDAPSVDPVQSTHYQAAFNWGVTCLARTSGVRIRQVAEKDQAVRWEAHLASSVRYQARDRCNKTMNIAQEVFRVLQPRAAADGTVVSLKELVESTRQNLPSNQFRESELKKALSLLSALKLVSLSAELLPMSYVLSMDSLYDTLDIHQSLWDELEDVNHMAELRGNAMEIFANLPTEAQNGFIEGYFSQSDAESLEAFLITQLGNIDDGGDATLNTFISEKLEHLRATEATKFFDRYEASEEPNQWRAICHPYHAHLLVNAGPGAGKTAVLVGRVVHLIRKQGIQPSEIIVLAFNRAVVFEIKKRVRELFRTLGYAAYVKRVRVSTFHSLAMRSFAQADGGRQQLPEREKLLSHFAQRLTADTQFRNQVAGGCRSVLVDEFQDVTTDIYQIIRQLHLGSGQSAGVTVIGDDDQDILRWEREDRDFSEKYFERFVDDFGGSDLQQLSLKVNFRSGVEIVEKSQKMISEIFRSNKHSRRVKDFQLHARQTPGMSEVERIDWKEWDTSQALDYVRQLCEQLDHKKSGSLAVLCQTNSEVAQAYRALAQAVPDLVALGAVNYPVAFLRHVGLWVEQLDAEIQSQNRLLTDDLKRKLIDQFKAKTEIPEVRQSQDTDVRLEDLWDLCLVEQGFGHLSDLARFIKDLQLDELGRLLGGQNDRTQKIVSTIHKVKGLEFDRVIVLPSNLNFGRPGSSQRDLAMDAAEQARLMYVAMTRAKSYLTYFVGRREYSWAQSQEFTGQLANGRILSGSHEEVALGWAMVANGFNPNPDACQAYIEKYVRVGDRVTLGGRGAGAGMSVMHHPSAARSFQVGFLSQKSGAGGHNSSLKVSAVVRFKPNRNQDGSYKDDLANSVQQRGWGYVVLVSGELR